MNGYGGSKGGMSMLTDSMFFFGPIPLKAVSWKKFVFGHLGQFIIVISGPLDGFQFWILQKPVKLLDSPDQAISHSET